MRRLWLLIPLLVAIASLGGSTRAYAVPPPLAQFGVSDGDLIDGGGWTELSNVAAVLTPDGTADNSFFRGAFHWAPTAASGPNFTTYDTAVTNAWADGLMVLPEIHTSIAGGGGYINPLTCSGVGCGQTAFENAVESIALRYGPGGTYTLAHPGFPGITRYEMWNEPNTNTGSIAASQSDDSDPAQIDAIVHAESDALVAAATQNGWLGQLQLACCAFGNPGNGNHAYSLTYFKSMVAADSSIWQAISPARAMPGVITVHMYYNDMTGPQNCVADMGTSETTGAEKCPQFLENSWAPYVHTTEAQPNVGFGITEGGYSGPINCSTSSPATTSEANQSTWNTWTVNYYRSVPDIDMEFLAYYEAMDSSVSGDTGHTCWQAGLAPVSSSGSFKPWGTALQGIVQADHSTGGPQPVASDAYSRTVSGGWGSADTGGAYTLTGNAGDVSVNGSQGVVDLSSAATTDQLALDGMTPVDSQASGFDATIPAIPSTGNVGIAIDDRLQSTGDNYRATFTVQHTGYVTVTVRSHVPGVSPDPVIETQTQFCKVQAGTPYHFEFDATGLNPTTLYAGCYVATGTPKGITATDSTPSLQAAGTNLVLVNPGATLPVPFEVDFDNLSVMPQ